MMNRAFLFIFGFLLVGLSGWGQVRIAELTGKGFLSWTNYIRAVGIYQVERAPSAGGPWRLLSVVVDQDIKWTNRISAYVPVTNDQSFYRVGWQVPDPDGVWELEGYHPDGVFFTGRLTMVSGAWLDHKLYGVAGSYAVVSTNLFHVYVGTGTLSGIMNSNTGYLSVWWPTNATHPLEFIGPIGSTQYTGRWGAVYLGSGFFNAVKISSIPGTNRP